MTLLLKSPSLMHNCEYPIQDARVMHEIIHQTFMGISFLYWSVSSKKKSNL